MIFATLPSTLLSKEAAGAALQIVAIVIPQAALWQAARAALRLRQLLWLCRHPGRRPALRRRALRRCSRPSFRAARSRAPRRPAPNRALGLASREIAR